LKAPAYRPAVGYGKTTLEFNSMRFCHAEIHCTFRCKFRRYLYIVCAVRARHCTPIGRYPDSRPDVVHYGLVHSRNALEPQTPIPQAGKKIRH